MKKILIYLLIFWLSSLLLLGLIVYGGDSLDNDYKININRIQNRLNEEPEEAERIISALKADQLGRIYEVSIIDYMSSDEQQKSSFFNQSRLEASFYLFKPIAESSYLVRYSIRNAGEKNFSDYIFTALLISIIFTVFSVYIYYNYRNTLKPLRKIADLPEKIAGGYIEELDIRHENKQLQKLYWGLDMLREKLKEEKKHSQELEKERKTLVAGLSHDIRTPLSSIKNYAIALKEGLYKDKADRDKAADIIIEKADMIDRLSKELLQSSNRELSAEEIDVEPEEIYLDSIAERLDKMISQKSELLHIDYQKDIPAENLLLKADLDALSQVFDNIIGNAVKYGDLQFIKLKYMQEDYYQLISIENSGPQIREAELKHIFSSYYRGSNVDDQPGFGLGLYISRKIMRKMEGDIYAENTEKGVRFVIVIRMAV